MANTCSYVDAQAVAAAVAATGIGKGVKDIYVPEWAPSPVAPIAPGTSAVLDQFCLRLNNGTEGFNCSYLKDFQKRFPLSWPQNLAAEVNAQFALLEAENA